jgi:hypothetical protein
MRSGVEGTLYPDWITARALNENTLCTSDFPAAVGSLYQRTL